MPIRWDKLTLKSQKAVERAGQLASERENPELLPLHILTALLEDRQGIAPPLFEKIGISPETVLQELRQELEGLPKVSPPAEPALSQAAHQLFDRAFKEADNFKDEYVSSEHLLLALSELKRDPAHQVLARHGATHDALLKALTAIRATHHRSGPGSQIPGARALCAGSDRASAPRQARSGDRAR
jgi:ATP-dependent Clp protease ATP-binding subunit ClpB